MRLELGCLVLWVQLLPWGPGSFTDANFTVVQSPSEVGVIRGDNATLNCTFSRGLSPDKGAVSWSRGGPGGEAAVPLRARFTLAYPDTFLHRGEGTLAITNVSLEDAGKYVCRVLLWGTGEARGNGTQLRVYARPSHPVVFLQFHPKPESKWTLVCRTAGFYPPPARLAWYQGSVRLPSTQPLQECGDPTGPLQASTTLDLPSSGPRATYTCQVMHPSLQNPLSTDYTYDPQHQDPPSLIAGLNLLKIALLGVLSLGVGLAAWLRPCLGRRRPLQGGEALSQKEPVRSVLGFTTRGRPSMGSPSPGAAPAAWIQGGSGNRRN
ncbi:tapasin-related protein-like [Chrysemys picta bellii]|uniref:tapasin-related protein-like n=1 Tax=Chrysemys picta bellii TaxID=8478 RepID=UPI0032B18C75